jgi:hypothetical protein
MLAGVAVSFDGTRETHNGIRGHHHAFDSALRGLDFLHAHRIPSAVAVCVSKRSIGELPDIAEVAVGHGATALQLRPFVVTGRAREAMPDEALDDDDVNLLVLLSLSLQQEFGRHLRVHCDLSSAQAVLAHRAQFAALVESNSGAHQALARMVNPLVLKEDGTLRPFTYDFAPDYDIGRIGPDLVESIGRFKNGGCTALARVVEDAFHMLEGRAGFIDWYDHCRVIGEKTTRRERQMPGRWTTLERSASGEPSHSSG